MQSPINAGFFVSLTTRFMLKCPWRMWAVDQMMKRVNTLQMMTMRRRKRRKMNDAES